MEHATDWRAVGLAIGWLLAVGVLFAYGLRLPLARRGRPWRRRVTAALVLLAGFALAGLAITALTLNDTHLDLTPQKLYTPAPAALNVVRGLRVPVAMTYFYQGQDPNARRAREMLTLLARENPLLTFKSVDPDKEPSLALTRGVKIYNAALIETGGRQLIVQGTDEAEIAIGIQRALREHAVTLCFVEGHNEYAIDNEEFHTHMDSGASHSHDDAASKVIETAGHGIGRLRRTLEALGYAVRRLPLATSPQIPADCATVVVANPRSTWLPGESAALREYLAQGGAALLLFDLGFSLELGLQQLLGTLGLDLQQAVVADRLSHYGTDEEMVAVTAYDPHPVTQRVAYTFFPGVRPLTLGTPEAGIVTWPLIRSGEASIVRAVASADRREVAASASAPDDPQPASRVLASVSEGRLAPDGKSFRAIVVGDADFASNSFYPYMANSDLALSMIRWLVREEGLAVVKPRVPVPPMVLLTERQLQSVYLLTALGLPLLAALGGLWVWWRRR